MRTIKPYKNIDAYIKDQPKDVRPILTNIRETVRSAAPKAQETISYGMPTFTQDGVLVHFAAFKKHIGFFPAPITDPVLSKAAAPYQKGKGTLQFPYGEKLPLGLIRKIVAYRKKLNKERVLARKAKS